MLAREKLENNFIGNVNGPLSTLSQAFAEGTFMAVGRLLDVLLAKKLFKFVLLIGDETLEL